jgi:bifunctional ADP-heptose synthase (sugar kinase/adenylyltransferase)
MQTILVIGDSCKDVYVYCKSIRLAPDIPIPVLEIEYEVSSPGMAQNVQKNLAKLSVNSSIITNKNWEDITKTRYVHEATNHTFIRIDKTTKIDALDLTTVELNADLIIVSDYNKGFLKESDIRFICENHPNVFLDSKKVIGEWANKAKYIKINNYEYTNSLPYLNQEMLKKVIHTNGDKGAFLNGKHFPVDKVEVRDSSGAGDTFLAALASKYLITEDIEKSIYFANKCASEVVKHKGTVTL